MLSQEKLLDFILLSIGDIQISKGTKEKLLKDPYRSDVIELRERLIQIMNELKLIYWIREAKIKDGLLPLTDDGQDEALKNEATSIYKKMCNLNCDIARMQKENAHGMETEYSVSN